MPRRRRLRKIVSPPGFKGYKPYGHIPNNKNVELLYEEYEALKLADYDLMNQLDASKLMGISRATFARIYESARRKIAQAIVESREIKTVFGNAHLDKDWYICNQCHARFNLPDESMDRNCPICHSKNLDPVITTNK